MHHRHRFDKIFVETKSAANRAGNRSYFKRMSQTRAMIITLTGKHLRFVGESAIGGTV